jgi:hypothetical protein
MQLGESLTITSGGNLIKTTLSVSAESITSQMSNMMSVYGFDTGEARIPYFVYSPFKNSAAALGSDDRLTRSTYGNVGTNHG